MDLERILRQIDRYYETNRGEEAEELMQEAVLLAVQERDNECLLQLLNELMGYYRETSRVEDSFLIAEKAITLAADMGLEGTIPYATTLLNAANAYRAGGRLQDSLQCYRQVEKIYDRKLAPDNMLAASLQNNLSLLYQEMGDFKQAKACLLKALPVVKAKGASFEEAVTYANLAGTCMGLEETEEAKSYAMHALERFDALGVKDAHYGAALSALGSYYYKVGQYRTAMEIFRQAMDIMEKNLGRNEYYYRLRDNAEACEKAILSSEAAGGHVAYAAHHSAAANPAVESPAQDERLQGLALCRLYYETWGKPMLEELFPDYVDKIAVGIAGEGSDCFGFDDALSMDHDWGPDLCLWVTDETYAKIGSALREAYERLPREFMGFRRTESDRGVGRRGVMTISAFYHRLLQASAWEDIDWHQVSDASLAAAVNGEVFRDDEGIFTAFRQKLKQGYPEYVRYLKIADSAARFSQAGQYNFFRMLKRGDRLSARLLLTECMKEAMKLQYYIEGIYPPHDKWLFTGLTKTRKGRELAAMLVRLDEEWERKGLLKGPGAGLDSGICSPIEEMASFFSMEMYAENLISDTDPYLEVHTDELVHKSALAARTNEELAEKITELEFEAFDKVKNAGGRASCQNDWHTFSIMRKSQYFTWNRTMLLQYLYDFSREYHRGHNLIEEKYGRMMESTAPEEYAGIRQYFPELSLEKKTVIEQIVQLQVEWMEEFAAEYPYLADNARSIRSAEDNLYNTSYETYLRGEISTYSDKMLELYGRYVVAYAREGKNPVFAIMENSVLLYGYDSLDAAENFLKN